MNTSASAKIHADFLRFLRTNPQEQVAAIVRCSRLDPQHEAVLQQSGFRGVRPLRLIKAYAVKGKAEDILALSRQKWVIGIEPDQPVHTMR